MQPWPNLLKTLYLYCKTVRLQISCEIICPGTRKKKTATMEEPILSRLDRLDNILKQLEQMRGGYHYPKSSTASTPSSGTLTSDGQPSSADFSPRRLEKKHCRPIDDVILETELKGTLIERLVHVEDCVFKLCLHLGEELQAENKKEEHIGTPTKSSRRKSFKHFVKSCMKGKRKDQNNH